MTRMTAGILLGLLVLTGSGATVAQTLQPLERYVNGHRGPYRGRVLDAETGTPLGGVVVVAVWRRERIMPLHSRSEHYAAREALTNADGDFVIDADDVERNAPKRTLRPYFTIFLPGYGRYRSEPGPTPRSGMNFFEGIGNTVELPKLNTKDERRMHLRTLAPYRLSEAPFIEIPEFMRLVNEESITLGLERYPSSGRQP